MMDIAQHQTQTQSNKSGDRKSDHRIKLMTKSLPITCGGRGGWGGGFLFEQFEDARLQFEHHVGEHGVFLQEGRVL